MILKNDLDYFVLMAYQLLRVTLLKTTFPCSITTVYFLTQSGSNKGFLTFPKGVVVDIMSRVFVNGPGDRDSISGRVIPKTKEKVLDAALLNTQHYKVRIKGKVEQPRE